MNDEVLPVGAFLLLAEVINGPAVVETMRHIVPIGGDHGVLDFGEVVEDLEVETAAGAQLVLIQHVEHAAEADAVAIFYPRIERDVRLSWPVLWQVFEKLHIRRDPERDARIVRPFDDRTVIDWRVVEAAGRKGHVVVSCALNQSIICVPVAFHTPWWAQICPSTSSRCRMRQGWPMIHGCRCSTISRPVAAPS